MKELALVTALEEYAGENRYIEIIAHAPHAKYIPRSSKDAITLDSSLAKYRMPSSFAAFTISIYIQITESEYMRPDKCIYLKNKLVSKLNFKKRHNVKVSYEIVSIPDKNGDYWYAIHYDI